MEHILFLIGKNAVRWQTNKENAGMSPGMGFVKDQLACSEHRKGIIESHFERNGFSKRAQEILRVQLHLRNERVERLEQTRLSDFYSEP